MPILDNISTILFDFDNTLVLLDENEFIKTYALRLADRFADVFTSAHDFVKHLIKGSIYTISTIDPTKTNVMKFFDYFSQYCGNLDYDEVYNRFFDYYNKEFKMVQQISRTHKYTQPLFTLLADKFDLVIATNPLFPEEAMITRLEWAGLKKFWDGGQIKLITDAEHFHTAKPRPEYYLEILKKLNLKSENCLMIGNDFFNDGAASLLDISFYHIKNEYENIDFLSEQTKQTIDQTKIIVNATGTLQEFYQLSKDFLS